MKITVLTDNIANRRGLVAEHGLSLYIEYGDKNILFDTGQTDVYRKNADFLGIDLAKTDCIVLSHGHYDHCGGLPFFPKMNKPPRVYIHKDAFEPKFASNPDGSLRDISIPWSRSDNPLSDSLVFTSGITEIAPGITLCPEVPASVAFESAPRGLFRGEGQSMTADLMRDEQMLIIDTDKGLNVFLGCSHPGIANCLSYIVKLFPGKRINSLTAGMHLDGVSPERLEKTIDLMLNLDIRKIIPLHCTGILSICEIKRHLKDRCVLLFTGDKLEI